MATGSLKTGSECVFEHPKWSESSLKKHVFLTPFGSQNGPLEGLLGAKQWLKTVRPKTGSKQPENMSSTPNGLGSRV